MWNTADWTAIENVLDLGFDLPDERLPAFTELAVRLHLLTPIEEDMFSFIHLLLRDHFGFPYALRHLRNTDADDRNFAANALGRIGDERAVEPLLVALRDADENVRDYAASALGDIGDARAVEPLIAALRDADENVRFWAAKALGQIGDAHAVAPLIQLLPDTSELEEWSSERVCDTAANALERIGTAEALAAVEASRQEQNRE